MANLSAVFDAILITRDGDGPVETALTQLDEGDLPEGSVTVDVEYSTINYKDGLAIMGRPGVVRSYPMVPGVDLAGTVAASGDDRYAPGDQVVLNGWEVGESHYGGLAQRARLDADWLVPLPDAFTTQQAMAIGTAGYTSMLSVLALEEHGVQPGDGPIVVTGAAGGVGSTAVAILAELGYEVVASTGRPDEAGYLRDLGASEVIDRAELSEPNPRGLQSVRWAGGVDAVGSHTLANVLAQTRPHGCVAACGLAQGPDLPATVLPFILRGVTLAGVNSVYEPYARRQQAWKRLATDLDPGQLEAMTEVVGLGEVIEVAGRILDGQVRGRVVVDVNR